MDDDRFGERHIESVRILDDLTRQLRARVNSGEPAESAVAYLAKGIFENFRPEETAELLAFAIGHAGDPEH
jgi:hypothetical protein